ncbi:MAG: hypothetical protein JSW31_09530 [Burkholderiales bacterium]|jgi:hypothetical protein|nr:MAG: hypothetical protein JSW31_09530 [Burkholderiales bacterium]
MNARNHAARITRLTLAAAVGACAAAGTLAAPMKVEAVISPKADSRMDFADGSKRFLVAAQREGKATGNGPLAGTTMLEWGMHDVNPATGANATGYLVFTTAEGDVAYIKYQFRGVPVPGPDGKPRFLANGNWETAGGTGKLKGLRGAGALQFIPAERRFVLDGDVVAAD